MPMRRSEIREDFDGNLDPHLVIIGKKIAHGGAGAILLMWEFLLIGGAMDHIRRYFGPKWPLAMSTSRKSQHMHQKFHVLSHKRDLTPPTLTQFGLSGGGFTNSTYSTLPQSGENAPPSKSATIAS